MCIFTGGGCIFLNYGVHGYGKRTFSPVNGRILAFMSGQREKEGEPERGKWVCLGFCLMQPPGRRFWLCFSVHACVLFQMASWFNHVFCGHISFFLVSCFPPLGRLSSFLGAPLFSFFFGWISISRRYACRRRSNNTTETI
jgi:hypothetical protein